MSDTGITLKAQFSKATTLVDGGWRISLDVNQSEIDAITRLSLMRGVFFQAAFVPISQNAEYGLDDQDMEEIQEDFIDG